METRCGPLIFASNFDSGNLARVEKVDKAVSSGVLSSQDSASSSQSKPKATAINETEPDYEYDCWTSPDCADTPFQNNNRTWFYFSVRGWLPGKTIRINLKNLNRQGRLYSQGHTVLAKVIPGKPKWERIRDRPHFESNEFGDFLLSFTYRFPEIRCAIAYFAFCYPWSYEACQGYLEKIDEQFSHCKTYKNCLNPDSVYYHREVVSDSIDGRRIDLITVTSCEGIQEEREQRIDPEYLFTDTETERCFTFKGKRVFLLSSRVHPGETPSSFVFNGFLQFILRESDLRAQQLRKQYVFKLIPMLNPDGVYRGFYRTDQRGTNLNRVYLDPDPTLHPSIYAVKSLLVYYHLIYSPLYYSPARETLPSVPKFNLIPQSSNFRSIFNRVGDGTSQPKYINPAQSLSTKTDDKPKQTPPFDSRQRLEMKPEDLKEATDKLPPQKNTENRVESIRRWLKSNPTQPCEAKSSIASSQIVPSFNTAAVCLNSDAIIKRYSPSKYCDITAKQKQKSHSLDKLTDSDSSSEADENEEKRNLADDSKIQGVKESLLTEQPPSIKSSNSSRSKNRRNRFSRKSRQTSCQSVEMSQNKSSDKPESSSQWSSVENEVVKTNLPFIAGPKDELVCLNISDSQKQDDAQNAADNPQNCESHPKSKLSNDICDKISKLGITHNQTENAPIECRLIPGASNDTLINAPVVQTKSESPPVSPVHMNGYIGNEGSDDDGVDFTPYPSGQCAPHLSDPALKIVAPENSGIAFYVDLHGHASKRGCFIYGNYLENEDDQVEAMLFARLVSLNTAHFEFAACNFSYKNMYHKDKREGLSKEGSGRVAVAKTLGIIHRMPQKSVTYIVGFDSQIYIIVLV